MPLIVPYTFVADTDALAAEMNANMDAVVAMFTEGAGGISDADISSTAAISGLKLSNTVGKQVPTDRIADAAITDAKLSSSSSVDANRAVGTDHIKALAVTKAKVAGSTLTLAQHDISIQAIPFAFFTSTNNSTYRLLAIRRNTNGSGNYEFVFAYEDCRTTAGAGGFIETTFTPGSAPSGSHGWGTGTDYGTAIPAATYELLAFYITKETYAGVNYINGNLIIVALKRS